MGRTVMDWALETGNERQPLPQMSAEQKIDPLTHLCSEFYVVCGNTVNYFSLDRKETMLLGEINMTRREEYTELSL